MADIMQLKPSITDSYKALPESIKDWLGSDLITNQISDINKKLGIKGKKRSIIPRLIIKLAVKDLLPQDFINELAKALNAPPAAAKAITQEISDKTLKPIEAGLRRDAGVEIKTIFFGKPAEAGAEELKPLEAIEAEAAPAPFTLEEKPAPTLAKGEVGVPTPSQGVGKKPEAANGETPALLYKEGTVGRIPIAKPEPEIAIKPRMIPTPPPIPAKPVAVPANEPKISRVVHYSDFFTPLNSLGFEKKPARDNSAFLDGNVVDLRMA